MRKLCLAGYALLFLSMPAPPEPARQFELSAGSPAFWELIDRGAQLTRVATGFGFTEGPVWDPAGFLYVSDETLNKIFRVYPDGRKETLIELGDPDGNTFDRAHHLIDCASVLRALQAADSEARLCPLPAHEPLTPRRTSLLFRLAPFVIASQAAGAQAGSTGSARAGNS
jgi:hypothetical protein